MNGCETSGSGSREAIGLQDSILASPLWRPLLMIASRAHRFELKPNDPQRTHFAKCAGVARFGWNWALAERQRLYREGQGDERFTNAVEQHRRLSALKRKGKARDAFAFTTGAARAEGGHVKDEMPLSERIYGCESCGLVLDRDLNAAINLVAVSSTETLNACGDLASTVPAKVPRAGSLKQEVNAAVPQGIGG